MTLHRLTILGLALSLGVACSSDGGIDDPGEGTICESGETSDCTCADGTAGQRDCETDGTFGTCGSCEVPGPVSFQNNIVPILAASCGAGLNGCHAREAFGANQGMDCRGWLSLENAPLGSVFYAGNQVGQPTGCPDMPLYERLMTLAPWQCAPDFSYVAAQDPGGSYLMAKIDGNNNDMCPSGDGQLSEKMPPADSGIVLGTGDRATLERWIVEGAPNN